MTLPPIRLARAVQHMATRAITTRGLTDLITRALLGPPPWRPPRRGRPATASPTSTHPEAPNEP